MRLCWGFAMILALASAGCMSGRRGHGGGGGGDDDGAGGRDPVIDGNDSENGTGNDPADPCAGYDPLPESVLASITGTYSADGMDSSQVEGMASLILFRGELEYEIEGSLVLQTPTGGELLSCNDGTGYAACYGGLSVNLCEGNAYVSYDVSTGAGSWSYYDSSGMAYGSGEILAGD